MNIVFLNKMYAEALDVTNKNDLHMYGTFAELSQTLPRRDLTEISSLSRAFTKIVNLYHSDKYECSLPENLCDTAWLENIDEYQVQITAEIGKINFINPLNGLNVSATMDGTIIVWPCDKVLKYNFADSIAKEIGFTKGQQAMLSVPNWCI